MKKETVSEIPNVAKDVDSKDKNINIGLGVLLFVLLFLKSGGFDAGGIAYIVGGFVGAIFISSILSWVYFKVVKADRTPTQKTRVMLTIAVIDGLILLFR